MDGWVATWGCALQPPDGEDDPELTGATLRQTIRVTAGGTTARLRLSNQYGRCALAVAAVAVALPRDGRAGAADIQPGTSRPLTFGGEAAVTIPPGGGATSDPFPLPVVAPANLSVTIQLDRATPVDGFTTHPGSRTTSHVVPAAAVPAGEPAALVARTTLAHAVPTVHWYLLAAAEVRPHEDTRAAVFLGDSLTDGRGSTTDGNDRWPDQLFDRLHAEGHVRGIAFVNQAAGGNRVLRDGLGIAAVDRLDRDVLGCAGVAWLVVLEGVNDIGTAEATAPGQRRIADELTTAYAGIIERAHARGIRVYGATLTPFGGHDYDDPAGLRERTRQRVNAWIRRHFDAVLDFDRVVRDPDNATRVRPDLHDGDHLHLNPVGYAALARAVPAGLFAAVPAGN